jgi:catechol 2,3-dioxygenase-like lactoylglutathione lyase family enzyme
MTVQLNHTIVHVRDKQAGARFLCDILGLPDPVPYGPFLVVETGNGVSLDYADGIQTEFTPQHYAFLVSDDDFDAIKVRLEERNVPYWADPFHREPGRINTDDGGRGLYWDDPDGHVLEIITVPYGG